MSNLRRRMTLHDLEIVGHFSDREQIVLKVRLEFRAMALPIQGVYQ